MENDTAPGLILVKTALDKLFDEATIEMAVVGKATALDEMVFTQDSATNAAVNSSVIGGGGYFQSTTDDVALTNEANIAAATLRQTLIVQFKKNLPISRTFMADQQLSAVSKAVRQQALTWGASETEMLSQFMQMVLRLRPRLMELLCSPLLTQTRTAIRSATCRQVF